MAANLLIILFFTFATLIANSRLKIFSFKPTFLGALFLLSLFVQIVPGTVLVAFFDYPMSFGVDTLITEESKLETFQYTFLSISILLLIISVASYICHFDIEIGKLNTSHFRIKLITFFSLLVIFLKIMSVGNIPFLLALKGDFDGAALAKAQILKNEVGLGGLFIGYIFVYFPYISLVCSYIHKKKHILGTLLFRINLLLIVIYSIYDMQKSKLIVVVFILFILYLKSVKSINYLLVTIIPTFSIVILCAFFMLLHNIPLGEVFDSVLARLFIGQTEGSFMIYQALTPNIERIAYGMPFGGLYGIYAMDPAAEIITIFFPTAGDAWVNSNSYFQAHAWSIFGDISLLIAPLVVALNIMGLYFLKEIFSRVDRTFASSVYIVSILTLPIVNDFSYFLFFKSWLCMIVLMMFYIMTIKVIELSCKFKN